MGNVEVDRCYFTGEWVETVWNDDDIIEYKVVVNGHNFLIKLPSEAANWRLDKLFPREYHVFHCLLFNNKWFRDKDDLITIDDLSELLIASDYPKTPSAKMDALLIKLESIMYEDGEKMELSRTDGFNLAAKLYFRSSKELSFYMKSLGELGYIEYSTDEYDYVDSFNLTVEGLSRIIELENEGVYSNFCFVAMSFKKESLPVRKAIKEALDDCGYKPIIMDEEHIDSDRTINDEIIAKLKKCKFCIADFSYHSNGVYFESGFALGQGKRVIYTCSSKEFDNRHFDIRPLQHIKYDTPEDLKRDLKFKIEAWIE